MFSYMVQTTGSAQGEQLFHTKAQALRAFEAMPVMEDQVLTLKQGAFTVGAHGLVYSQGKTFTLDQRVGWDEVEHDTPSIVLSFDHCSTPGDAEQWYDSSQDRIANGFCVAWADKERMEGAYLVEAASYKEAQEVFRSDLLSHSYKPEDYGL
jgi:hypothetical protein